MSKDKDYKRIAFLCFFLSGLSALVYQIAWVKSLSLVFGTSHLAVATVLAAYMFGLAVGAFLASIFLTRVKKPVIVYGVLEAIIALGALFVPTGISLCLIIYVFIFGGQETPEAVIGIMQPLFFLSTAFIVLAVPTIAMGATLPLLIKFVIVDEESVGPSVGTLYFSNTFGAVIGVLLAGFALLPYFGLYGTMGFAAIINIAIFLLIYILFRNNAPAVLASRSPEKTYVHISNFDWRFFLSFATGVLSFSLEVYWTRLLSHLMGGSTYAFAIMLASFLSGIAFGGWVGGKVSKNKRTAQKYYPIAQILIAITTLVAYLVIQNIGLNNTLTLYQNAVLVFCTLFPGAFFLGMTFPLLIKIIVVKVQEASRVTAISYSWNTMGAILGSILTGFLFLPFLGFESFLKVVACLFCGIASLFYLKQTSPRNRLACSLSLGLFVLIAFMPIREPYSILYAHIKAPDSEVLQEFYGVGKSSTVLVHKENGYFKLSSNGLSESAIGSKGMPPYNLSQKWLTGLPSLARPYAKKFGIVGLGGGIAIHGVPPSADSIDVFELEPLVKDANQVVSEKRTRDPLQDHRLNIVLNDARNALSLTTKKYDVIVSQPSHPWTGGASHLYTSEFLKLAKSRMSKDGVFLQWINSQFIDPHLFKVMTSTLLEQFLYVELYQPERQVLMFLASNSPIDIWNGKQNALKSLELNREHFNKMGVSNMEDVLAMLTFDQYGLEAISEGSQINTDSKNSLAYFSKIRGDGMSADDLLSIFSQFDPFVNQRSDFNQKYIKTISVPYLAEKLMQFNFIERTEKLSNSLVNKTDTLLVDAIGMEYSGEIVKATNIYERILAENKSNTDAEIGMLRIHLPDFSRLALPADIAALANKQVGPIRAVLEGWILGATGRFDEISRLDKMLSLVETNSLLYSVSIKLRIDWRLWKAIESGNKDYAKEGLELIDRLLAGFWNADLYILRYQLAKQMDMPYEQFESLFAASEQLKIHAKENNYNKEFINRKNFIKSSLVSFKSEYSELYFDSRLDKLFIKLDKL